MERFRTDSSQDDQSVKTFPNYVLDIRNGEIELHPNTSCIKLPDNSVLLFRQKNEFIERVFPDRLNNHLDNDWPCHPVTYAENMLMLTK
ncbi:hypothetical protein TNCV_762151 [Trichonephila clavipes]|nr:hypothetical protein TNCV_762151 [Trichonephila clavipes]